MTMPRRKPPTELDLFARRCVVAELSSDEIAMLIRIIAVCDPVSRAGMRRWPQGDAGIIIPPMPRSEGVGIIEAIIHKKALLFDGSHAYVPGTAQALCKLPGGNRREGVVSALVEAVGSRVAAMVAEELLDSDITFEIDHTIKLQAVIRAVEEGGCELEDWVENRGAQGEILFNPERKPVSSDSESSGSGEVVRYLGAKVGRRVRLIEASGATITLEPVPDATKLRNFPEKELVNIVATTLVALMRTKVSSNGDETTMFDHWATWQAARARRPGISKQSVSQAITSLRPIVNMVRLGDEGKQAVACTLSQVDWKSINPSWLATADHGSRKRNQHRPQAVTRRSSNLEVDF